MSRIEDFLCTEQPSHPAVSSKLLDDQRRLMTFLKQEERFMPNDFQMRRNVDEKIRTDMLESIYEVRQVASSQGGQCTNITLSLCIV